MSLAGAVAANVLAEEALETSKVLRQEARTNLQAERAELSLARAKRKQASDQVESDKEALSEAIENCPGSEGDPHITTFDGLYYNFQEQGEFTLIGSSADNFKVQVRQEKSLSNPLTTVNTAVATIVDGNRVGFYALNDSSILINGVEQSLESGDVLKLGNGQIEFDGEYHTLTNENGDIIFIDLKSRSLDINVALASNREGNTFGLLGNNNGNQNDDLVLEDGIEIDPANFNQFVESYADNWRISSDESLFDYQKGEYTSKFNQSEYDFIDNATKYRGTDENDVIEGSKRNDVLMGLKGDDYLRGKAGRDWLVGKQGDDTLIGNGGDDYLVGNGGSDHLLGGDGADVFIVATGKAGKGIDTISDFVDGVDLIGLSGGISFNDLALSNNTISFNDEILAILTGIDTTTLANDNFTIV